MHPSDAERVGILLTVGCALCTGGTFVALAFDDPRQAGVLAMAAVFFGVLAVVAFIGSTR